MALQSIMARLGNENARFQASCRDPYRFCGNTISKIRLFRLSSNAIFRFAFTRHKICAIFGTASHKTVKPRHIRVSSPTKRNAALGFHPKAAAAFPILNHPSIPGSVLFKNSVFTFCFCVESIRFRAFSKSAAGGYRSLPWCILIAQTPRVYWLLPLYP